LARDYQLPPRVYYNYCKVDDHTIEYHPQLVAKWKAKGPQNQNVLKISIEEIDEPPKVSIITRSGVKTNEDVTTLEIQQVP